MTDKKHIEEIPHYTCETCPNVIFFSLGDYQNHICNNSKSKFSNLITEIRDRLIEIEAGNYLECDEIYQIERIGFFLGDIQDKYKLLVKDR